MAVSHVNKTKGVLRESQGSKDVVRKVLITPRDGWDSHVMRYFELGEGGYCAKESHPWPHIVFFSKGKGILHLSGVDYEVEEGSYAFIPGNEVHQLINRGEGKFEFVCIVPKEGHVK